MEKIPPFVTNLSDFAGIQGIPITLMQQLRLIRVLSSIVFISKMAIGFLMLPECNWNDPINGYAGNGQIIDAIEVYYSTPEDIVNRHGYQKAQYRTSPVNGRITILGSMIMRPGNGQDGYAGCFGVAMDRFQLF